MKLTKLAVALPLFEIKMGLMIRHQPP
jgi:hypothetical protein